MTDLLVFVEPKTAKDRTNNLTEREIQMSDKALLARKTKNVTGCAKVFLLCLVLAGIPKMLRGLFVMPSEIK